MTEAEARTTTVIRDLNPSVTTFTCPFNRFAPFGYRKFVAVGLRMTAIRLQQDDSTRILIIAPIPLNDDIREKLHSLGGVDFIAADLGHHLYVKEYQDEWPEAKTIGVPGLSQKRNDLRWDMVYESRSMKPEAEFGWNDMETVVFEGFITWCVAWVHKPTQTLVCTDLLMNLPCTEQYDYPPSDPLSRAFAFAAHPFSTWHKRLIYYMAGVDDNLMRRDVKAVFEMDFEVVIPSHGDVIETEGKEAWSELYEWYLRPGEDSMREKVMRSVWSRCLKWGRWYFLM
ncbi:hypothetical protein YB2330_004195 [Saitoella coloradoensis]